MATTTTKIRRYICPHYNLSTGQTYPWENRKVITTTDAVTQQSSVPNFKYKLRNGIDATSTFVATEQYISWTPGYAEVRWDYSPTDKRRTVYSGAPPRDSALPVVSMFFSDEDKAKALIKLYDAIKSEKTAMSGGTFLGEFAETVRMLRRPLMGLRDGLTNYRDLVRTRAKGVKAVKGRLKALNRMISQTWLEVQFGMKPLFNDIHDICQEIDEAGDRVEAQLVSLKGVSRREKVRSVRFWNNSDTGLSRGQPFGQTPMAYDYIETIVDEVLVIYRCGYKREVDVWRVKPALEAVRDRFGFNLEDFVPTVWNLIPTSFITDYFSSVGGILQASFTDTRGVTWVNRTVVEKSTSVTQLMLNRKNITDLCTGGTKKLHYVIDKGLGNVVAYRKNVDRRSVGLDIPPLVFYTPPADSLKWLNLAALTSSFLTLSNTLRKG